jgi:hypothetical protein
MKHTSGPWNVHQNGDGSYSILGEKLSEKEYRWIIGFSMNGEICNEEQKENIQLIAAAPDMLECLKQFIIVWDNEDRDDNKVFDAFCKAKKLIEILEKDEIKQT